MLNLDSFPLLLFDMGVGGVRRRLPSFPLHMLMYVFVCMYYCHTETSLMSVLVSWALSSFFTCPLLPTTPHHSTPLPPAKPSTPNSTLLYRIKTWSQTLLRYFLYHINRKLLMQNLSKKSGKKWSGILCIKDKSFTVECVPSDNLWCCHQSLHPRLAATILGLQPAPYRLLTTFNETSTQAQEWTKKASTPDPRLLYWTCSLLPNACLQLVTMTQQTTDKMYT